MENRIKAETTPTIADLQLANIRTVMVTGDNVELHVFHAVLTLGHVHVCRLACSILFKIMRVAHLQLKAWH